MLIRLSVVVVLLLMGSTASAGKIVGSASGGYYVKQGSNDGSSGTWSIDIDLGFKVKEQAAVCVGFGSVELSSVSVGGAQIRDKNVFLPIFGQFYLSEGERKIGVLLDVGYSINFLDPERKVGLLGGVGFLLPVGTISLLARARYIKVPKVGDLDASTLQFTAGIHFGR